MGEQQEGQRKSFIVKCLFEIARFEAMHNNEVEYDEVATTDNDRCRMAYVHASLNARKRNEECEAGGLRV